MAGKRQPGSSTTSISVHAARPPIVMHRILPRAAGPYRVIFAPEAWRQIGLMPTALFEVLQKAVDDLAERCGRLSTPGAEKPVRLSLAVGSLVVLYERDDATRTLLLVDIQRTPESP
ncbi:hypothetical protein JY651_46595 [Pyxidicoccus parkwayensis]|uniref:Type II toxin-antitoxin system RelE/ParE family toxin n=1 Tax=Pyxidicoccus parkwayensis TaxID=2813578 RepID=A0ABX7NUN6_9BACT|nr:hypothetical protein [Pyxidicoccus parkwaysis]QSQ22505.1 hypothetical protein JY651_46595 [Pyxidicoccus parkwaysis]